MKLDVQRDIMQINNDIAAENRKAFETSGLFVINLIGSPGSGKTTLLERLISTLPELKIGVIEGDLATARDAQRIAEQGVQVVQVNTDGGCHLDARMISRILPVFDLSVLDLLIIENVGNLVCPASYDLGEDMRLLLLSVAEGTDKPGKYPTTFVTADAVIINKLDMLELTDFDMQTARADILAIKPQVEIFETICRAGHVKGLNAVAEYIQQHIGIKRGL